MPPGTSVCSDRDCLRCRKNRLFAPRLAPGGTRWLRTHIVDEFLVAAGQLDTRAIHELDAVIVSPRAAV
jgi:hypothetical protein